MSVAIAPRRLARRSDHHGFGRLRPVASEDTGAVALALPRGFRYREVDPSPAVPSAAWLFGVRYASEGSCLCRHVQGAPQALAVRGRPGFGAGEAIAGLAYRTEWAPPGAPGVALLGARGLAAVGGRVLVAGAGELWAFEPRGPLGGVLTLLERRDDDPLLVGALAGRALVASGHELRLRDPGGAEHPLARVLTGAPLAARLDGAALHLQVAPPARAFAIRGALRT